jgi:S1-C subfamily serine protease
LNAGSGQSGSIGLGFAIPINSAIGIATQLIRTGTVVHASIGAQTRSVTDGSRLGAYVVQVDPGQAAAKAGLKEGDVIKLVDKTLISGSDSLVVAVNLHKPGDVVAVRYIRAGKELTTTLTFDTAK